MPSTTPPSTNDLRERAARLLKFAYRNVAENTSAKAIKRHVDNGTVPKNASLMVIRRLRRIYNALYGDDAIDHLAARFGSQGLGD